MRPGGGRMAPRLVLVHGIGGPRRVEEDRECWISALAEGARKAGHSAAAQRLADGTLADVVFAYYGDLFFSEQAQGSENAELDDSETALLIDLLAEVIQQHRADGDVDQESLRRAQAKLRPEGQPQGTGAPVRRA